MKPETMSRHLHQACNGIKRNKWMSFAAIISVSITLFVFGIFLLIVKNAYFISSEMEKQVAIKVALNSELNDQQKRSIEKKIQGMSEVKSAELVSKEQIIKRMKEIWGTKDVDIFKGMEKNKANPFPDTIEVYPKKPKMTSVLAEQIRKWDSEISEVDYAPNLTGQILRISGWFQKYVLSFGVFLAMLAAFLISNTIKLTIGARKEEIQIQRLVGASNWFIRWPFLFEGILIGSAGSIVPIILVLTLYESVFNTFNGPIFKLLPVSSLIVFIAVSIFLLGAFIGMLGSVFSVRRFLNDVTV